MFQIITAKTTNHLDSVRALFLEYAESLGFDLCFQDFQKELDTLPAKYAEPEGTILLAFEDSKAIGVVALWKLSDGVCEMKRLYTKPETRGKGLGKALAQAIIQEAKNRNYELMKLDTLVRMTAANALYQSLNFEETMPYNYNPENDVRYYAKSLN
jgi:ribosomal protein S18 acetylase RimI-like enzyme